jgi:DNA-binding XRE family transcriptional regulator
LYFTIILFVIMKRRFLEAEEQEINIEAGIQAMSFARAARASTGLSQRKFAKRARLSSNTVARIEANTCPNPPRLSTLIKIARGAGQRLTLTLGAND